MEVVESAKSQKSPEVVEAPKEEQPEISAFEVQASNEDASMHEENKEPEPKQEE